MKNLFLTFILFLVFCSGCCGQQWLWGKTSNIPYGYFLQGVQASEGLGGSFYVSGYNWDQNNGLPFGSTIIKFDANGNELWRKTWTEKIRIYAIHADAAGNLFVAGDFAESITVNGVVHAAQAETDGFVLYMDQAGTILWFQSLAGPRAECIRDIYIDSATQVFLTGLYSDSSMFQGNVMHTLSVGSTFIFRLSNSGTLLQTMSSDDPNPSYSNYGCKIRTDNAGNIYILGCYNGVQFDSFSEYYGGPYSAYYLTKLDPAGNSLFLVSVVDFTEIMTDMVINGGDIYVTGAGGWTSGGWTVTKKYSGTGTLMWEKQNSGSYFGYSSNGLANAGTGIYTVGYEADPDVPNWNTTYSLMLSKYSDSGIQTATRVICSGRPDGYNIKLLADGSYLVTGATPDSMTLGSYVLKKSTGNIFVAKFHEQGTTTPADEMAGQNEISVYPNPTPGKFEVSLKDEFKNSQICVYDLAGRCVLEENTGRKNNIALDLGNNPPGTYVVTIVKGSQCLRKKLVLD